MYICGDATVLPLTCLLFCVSTDRKLHILSRPAATDVSQDAARLPGVEDEEAETSSVPGTPRFTPQDEGNSNNILAYVSVLAAVVLGLLVYVAYKWCVLKRDRL